MESFLKENHEGFVKYNKATTRHNSHFNGLNEEKMKLIVQQNGNFDQNLLRVYQLNLQRFTLFLSE